MQQNPYFQLIFSHSMASRIHDSLRTTNKELAAYQNQLSGKKRKSYALNLHVGILHYYT